MLTEEQVHETIRQMIVKCDELMDGYQMVSARTAIRLVGMEEHTDQLLRFIADGGFDYCLDHTIVMTGHHEATGEKPNWQVCYWGPDQLKSRLSCLNNLPWQYRQA